MFERTATKKKHGDTYKQRVLSAGWFSDWLALAGWLTGWLAVSRYSTRIWFRFYCPRIAEAIFRLLRPLRRRPSWISPVRSWTTAFANRDKNIYKNLSSRGVSVFHCSIISRNIVARNDPCSESEPPESHIFFHRSVSWCRKNIGNIITIIQVLYLKATLNYMYDLCNTRKCLINLPWWDLKLKNEKYLLKIPNKHFKVLKFRENKKNCRTYKCIITSSNLVSFQSILVTKQFPLTHTFNVITRLVTNLRRKRWPASRYETISTRICEFLSVGRSILLGWNRQNEMNRSGKTVFREREAKWLAARLSRTRLFARGADAGRI